MQKNTDFLKVMAIFVVPALLLILMLQGSTCAQGSGTWQLRAEFIGNSSSGWGRKLTIENEKILVGSIETALVVNPIFGTSEPAMIELQIEDPNENVGVSGCPQNNPVNNRCGFGYSVSLCQTGPGEYQMMIGDTGHLMDAGQPVEGLFGAVIGQAHLFSLDATGNTQKLADFSNPVPFNVVEIFPDLAPGLMAPVGSEFGHDVAMGGNFAAVGGPFDATNGYHPDTLGTGKAFAFELNSGTPEEPHELLDPTSIVGDVFGAYLAMSNGIIAVSDQGDDAFLFKGEGKVHLYDTTNISSSGSDPISPFETIMPHTATMRQFGWDVDMHDNLILVGHTYGASLYELNGQQASHVFMITDPDIFNLGEFATFGRHVALDGERMVVARQGYTNGNADIIIPEGVYVSNTTWSGKLYP